MVLRAVLGASAAVLISAAAHAEPLTLTDDQMDSVTAGLSVNGKLIASNTSTEDTINASANNTTLPTAADNALWSPHIATDSNPGDPNNVITNP